MIPQFKKYFAATSESFFFFHTVARHWSHPIEGSVPGVALKGFLDVQVAKGFLVEKIIDDKKAKRS